MIDRFRGEEGRRLLLAALERQPIIHTPDVARRIADAGELEAYGAQTKIITQGGSDNEIFLLLDGEVSIEVNGRVVASRKVGQHVGEMALIDPVGRRTATVTTKSDIVCLKVSEPNFTAIANDHPQIWRALATELVERFRQRGAMLKAPNDKPRVFLGSSSAKGLPIAEAIQVGLSHVDAVVQPWTQGVFTASRTTIEALEEQAASTDFAVLVLSDDDVAEIRGRETHIPRDNVVFELGLFLGAIGRERTYMVVPRGIDIALPTDLMGITPLTFAEGDAQDLASRVGPVCTAIKGHIGRLGPR